MRLPFSHSAFCISLSWEDYSWATKLLLPDLENKAVHDCVLIQDLTVLWCWDQNLWPWLEVHLQWLSVHNSHSSWFILFSRQYRISVSKPISAFFLLIYHIIYFSQCYKKILDKENNVYFIQHILIVFSPLQYLPDTLHLLTYPISSCFSCVS